MKSASLALTSSTPTARNSAGSGFQNGVQGSFVLDQLAACGTPGQLREQLEPWDHAVDVVTFMLPPGMPWDTIEATLRAAAPGA